MEEDRPGV